MQVNKNSVQVGIYCAIYLQRLCGLNLVSQLKKKWNTSLEFTRRGKKSWNYNCLFAGWIINSSLTDPCHQTGALTGQTE